MFWIGKEGDKEAVAEEIAQGQIVIITARWILILAGWVLALWEPEQTSAWELRLAIVLLMSYSALNFFLTIQWLNRGRILTETALAMSMADLALITTLAAALGSGNVFVFYLPALLAMAVTFPTSVTAAYTSMVVVAYGFIAFENAGSTVEMTEAQTIVTRLIVLVAVAFCGALYRTIEFERRENRGRMYRLFRAAGPDELPNWESNHSGRKPLQIDG